MLIGRVRTLKYKEVRCTDTEPRKEPEGRPEGPGDPQAARGGAPRRGRGYMGRLGLPPGWSLKIAPPVTTELCVTTLRSPTIPCIVLLAFLLALPWYSWPFNFEPEQLKTNTFEGFQGLLGKAMQGKGGEAQEFLQTHIYIVRVSRRIDLL